ncbi:hypothetical protein [Embleya sp. NPDC020630]|uniref:hypothetical protein n=1 Tax=Embleya sp. NPDC020630 TaxID=3363979 RepID=UPI00379AAFEF
MRRRRAVLILAEIAALIGTTVFAIAGPSRSVRGRAAHAPGALGALSVPGMRTLVLTLAAAGAVIGMLYIEVPAFVAGAGSATAGLLLAVMAGGSMVGGLWYGARTWASGVDRRYVWLSGAFAASVVPPALARTALHLGVLLLFVGAAYAPRMISAYFMLDHLAPHDCPTEAYTWLVGAGAAGGASGSALAGPLVQHVGVRGAFVGTALRAAAAHITALARRDTLTPPPTPHPAPRPRSAPDGRRDAA